MLNVWNNANQVHRIKYRFYPYLFMTGKIIYKGASFPRIISSRFPHFFSDNKYPVSVAIELTNACDLQCLYCNNPLFSHPRSIMKDEVFDQLEVSLKEMKSDRIRVGGGEPTLHPKFEQYSKRLRESTKFNAIVTNGQWKDEATIKALLLNYDYLEISIDAGGKKMYEYSRKGASYELLIRNLKKLNRLKKELNSNTTLNLRLMIRPSNDAEKQLDIERYKKYFDTIMPQYLVKHHDSTYSEDVFNSVHVVESDFPNCTYPFKEMQVREDGNVPMCAISGSAIDPNKKVIVGNVLESSLMRLWKGTILSSLRKAHRERNEAQMSLCKGCRGC